MSLLYHGLTGIIRYGEPAFSVQSGEASITSTTLDVTLDEPVNTDESFAVVSFINSSSGNNNVILVKASLSDVNTLSLERYATTGTSTVMWQVVSWPGARVQHVGGSTTAGTLDAPIDPVDLNRSFLVQSFRQNTAGISVHLHPRAFFVDNETVRHQRASTTSTMDVSTFVVELPEAEVMSGNISMASAQSIVSQTLSRHVDFDHTFMTSSFSTNSSQTTSKVAGDLGSTNAARAGRMNTSGTADVPYFVIESHKDFTVQSYITAFEGLEQFVTLDTPVDPAHTFVVTTEATNTTNALSAYGTVQLVDENTIKLTRANNSGWLEFYYYVISAQNVPAR